MPISMSKYVRVTSGIGGASQVARRSFVGRVFSTSQLIDPASVLSFSDAASVGTYFGTTSEEYTRAVAYFGYVSPSIRSPQSLQFARYCPTAAPASIFGATTAFTLATLQAITAGLLTFNFGGTIVAVTGINLSTATSLATVASVLQAALRLNSNANLASCTVTYSATTSSFTFQASTPSATASFSLVAAGTGATDVATNLGWTTGAIITSAHLAEAPVDAFTRSQVFNNNFGSFVFDTDCAVTLLQATAVATYNATLNVMFMYHINVSATNAAAWSATLLATAGVMLSLSDPNGAFPEMLPMAIQAATDFNQRNGIQNYEYKQMSQLTPSVTDDTTANSYDALRVNYYGQTQTAGQKISFYQPGVLCGPAVSPQTANVWANEAWLKDYVAASILNLQLSLPQWSANASGRGMLMTLVQAAVGAALFNGVISVGKPLTTNQILYVTQLTGDDKAWLSVQNKGYYMYSSITSAVDPVSGVTVYTANYTLVYSKNDAIRNVVGSHVLI